jgi:hypothetical protein
MEIFLHGKIKQSECAIKVRPAQGSGAALPVVILANHPEGSLSR